MGEVCGHLQKITVGHKIEVGTKFVNISVGQLGRYVLGNKYIVENMKLSK